MMNIDVMFHKRMRKLCTLPMFFSRLDGTPSEKRMPRVRNGISCL